MNPLPAQEHSLPLVLGGHSFIQQLGKDPRPNEELATEIVAACLEQGITWFDTTYQPERIALGKALTRLNARDRATILVWNFFHDFDDSGEVGGPSHYRPESLDLLCEQLQTSTIDILVIHPMGNPDEDRRQEDLVRSWQSQGRVRRLAAWCPRLDMVQSSLYHFAIAPGNIADNGGGRFANYQVQGWETLATSPFVRGWLLQRLAERSGRSAAEIADLLLRYAAFLPGVDRLIVSIRQPRWVTTNAESWKRGPLNPGETALLHDLFTRFGAA